MKNKTDEWTAEWLQEQGVQGINTRNLVCRLHNAALAAEREKPDGMKSGGVQQMDEQLAAEREKYIELCDKANGDMIALNKELAAEREVGGNTAIALAQQIIKLEDKLAALGKIQK